MKTSDFDYVLPSELIAQRPLADRAGSRMLVVNRVTGEIRHDHFRNIGQYVRAGDLLVLNDTKVIPARIWAKQPAVELLLVERLDAGHWTALVKPGKRAKVGMTLRFEDDVSAVVEGNTDFGGRVLEFSGDVDAYMATYGAAPLPPYIKRAGERGRRLSGATGRPAQSGAPTFSDLERYQTVFARRPGAVAAPTAGLHFTNELLHQLEAAGVGHAFITLHVGIGTFQPVKVENVEEHQLHAERFSVSADAAAAVRAARGSDTCPDRFGVPVATPNASGQAGRARNGPPTGRTGRVVAVGTTVVRTLESLDELRACEGTTDIFIRPPFKFRFADVMLTNFHLPRSTLLMLVCAFASRELILRAYEEAVRDRYRFFSYGDCMLIL